MNILRFFMEASLRDKPSNYWPLTYSITKIVSKKAVYL